MTRRLLTSIPRVLALVASLAFSREVRAADPTTADCLSANDRSIALRNEHKMRAARGQLLVCAAASCPADVRNECVRRVAEVNVSMPTIVFVVKDPSGSELTTVKVTMDGEALADRLEGTAVSLDPGAHSFTFEAAGLPPLTKEMVIREGEKDRRDVVQLGAVAAGAGAASTPPSGPAALPPSSYPSTPPVAPERHGMGTQRVLAIVAAGIGVAGIGVGTIFGIQAVSKHNDAVKSCPGACLDQRGVDLWNQAIAAGNLSTLGFVVGAVGLGAGVVLWLTATTPGGSSTQVGVGPGSLRIRGEW